MPWRLRYDYGRRLVNYGRVLSVKATHLHCRVEFNGPVRIGPGFQLDILDAGTFIVGPNVDFRRGFACEIADQGRVVIGAGTAFTSNVLIQCTTSIEIGERCAVGQSVLIVDGFHKYMGQDQHWLDQGYDFVPITIGDGVGISDKCTVQASIGEHSLIASHASVTRPIPAYSLAAGVPARVVRHIGPDELHPANAPLHEPRDRVG